MRADVNVSVRKPGGELGTRTETKNVNCGPLRHGGRLSMRRSRQVELIEGGGTIVQETRLFDPDKGVTRSLRSKEDAHDYRYFPDPDLLPLELDEAFLEECRASLPELPDAKRKRYEALGITAYNASVLTAEVETARWFDTLLDSRRGAEAGGQLGRRRAVRRAQPPRRSNRGKPGRAGAGRRAARPRRRRHDLRHHRQAGVRDHARDRRGRGRTSSRSAGSSRPATPARSTPKSTRSSPPMPTRSSSTRLASSSCSASSSARR